MSVSRCQASRCRRVDKAYPENLSPFGDNVAKPQGISGAREVAKEGEKGTVKIYNFLSWIPVFLVLIYKLL